MASRELIRISAEAGQIHSHAGLLDYCARFCDFLVHPDAEWTATFDALATPAKSVPPTSTSNQKFNIVPSNEGDPIDCDMLLSMLFCFVSALRGYRASPIAKKEWFRHGIAAFAALHHHIVVNDMPIRNAKVEILLASGLVGSSDKPANLRLCHSSRRGHWQMLTNGELVVSDGEIKATKLPAYEQVKRIGQVMAGVVAKKLGVPYTPSTPPGTARPPPSESIRGLVEHAAVEIDRVRAQQSHPQV